MRRFPPPRVPSQIYRILAYGNSFTAGVSGTNLFPYSVFLERILQATLSEDEVTVSHRGNPGWTTRGMLNTLDGKHVGLRSAIVKLGATNPPLSLVILMAGSNDLTRPSAQVDDITKNLIQLHRVCFENNVPRTISIGIPPSGLQAENSEIASKAASINDNLERYFSSAGDSNGSIRRTTFVPFPFPFLRRGKNWYPDDLHLTETGYQVLAQSLAPIVVNVLQSLDKDRQ